MAHFVPEDTDFCFARIEGKNHSEKISYIANWLSYWLRFQASIGNFGSVVFDIDDTLVDNRERKIAPIVNVFQLANKLGFICNLITARPEVPGNRKATKKMLAENGIIQYESLYMMSPKLSNTTEGISRYKYEARCDVETRHNIVANLGDMWHDMFKYPIHTSIRPLLNRPIEQCAIFFQPYLRGEVSIKLIGKYYDDDD